MSERKANQAHIRTLQESVATALQPSEAPTPLTPTTPTVTVTLAAEPAAGAALAAGVALAAVPSAEAATKKRMTLPDPPWFDRDRRKFRM